MTHKIFHRSAGVILTTIVEETEDRVICRMPFYLDHNRISLQEWIPFRRSDVLSIETADKERHTIYLNKKAEKIVNTFYMGANTAWKNVIAYCVGSKFYFL